MQENHITDLITKIPNAIVEFTKAEKLFEYYINETFIAKYDLNFNLFRNSTGIEYCYWISVKRINMSFVNQDTKAHNFMLHVFVSDSF